MEIEYRSLKEIKKYQEERLAGALEYLAARSPFYQNIFCTSKIDIRKIKTWKIYGPFLSLLKVICRRIIRIFYAFPVIKS
jgi:phenylacetate-coenzyme A ligase PaaK-like adenylate-forming protein